MGDNNSYFSYETKDNKVFRSEVENGIIDNKISQYIESPIEDIVAISVHSCRIVNFNWELSLSHFPNLDFIGLYKCEIIDEFNIYRKDIKIDIEQCRFSNDFSVILNSKYMDYLNGQPVDYKSLHLSDNNFKNVKIFGVFGVTDFIKNTVEGEVDIQGRYEHVNEFDKNTVEKDFIFGIFPIYKNNKIEIINSEISGNLISKNNKEILNDIIIDKTTIKNNIVFDDNIINSRIEIKESSIGGIVRLENTTIRENAILKGIELEKSVFLNSLIYAYDFRGIASNGKYRLKDEDNINDESPYQQYSDLAMTYRQLKLAYRRSDMYDIADKMAIKQKETLHKYYGKNRRNNKGKYLSSLVQKWIWGWGHKPINIIISSIAFFLIFMAIYLILGIYDYSTNTIIYYNSSHSLAYSLFQGALYSISNYIGFGVSHLKVDIYMPLLITYLEIILGKIMLALGIYSITKKHYFE